MFHPSQSIGIHVTDLSIEIDLFFRHVIIWKVAYLQTEKIGLTFLEPRNLKNIIFYLTNKKENQVFCIWLIIA